MTEAMAAAVRVFRLVTRRAICRGRARTGSGRGLIPHHSPRPAPRAKHALQSRPSRESIDDREDAGAAAPSQAAGESAQGAAPGSGRRGAEEATASVTRRMAAARRLAALLLAALAAGCSAVRSAGPRAADYVVVVMLDGARPDILRRAQAPVIHGLEAEGTSWLQARTAYPSQTRVAFVTLPTGAYPEHHGSVGGDEFQDADWNPIPAGDQG